MLSKEELHEQILYPVVRVRTSEAGGSGTVIYSEPDPKNVEEYLTFIGYDKEKVEKEFEEKASKVHKDEIPERVKMIETPGGGIDTAGGNKPRYGGFGPIPKD